MNIKINYKLLKNFLMDCVLGPLLCPFMEHLQPLVHFSALLSCLVLAVFYSPLRKLIVSRINDDEDDLWFCQSTVDLMLLIIVNRYLVCSNQSPADSSRLHLLSHISECHCMLPMLGMTGMSRSTHLAPDFITSITR